MDIEVLKRQGYLHHPGYLKLELMLKGAQPDEAVLEVWNRGNTYSTRVGSGPGIDLILREGSWVRVPILDSLSLRSPYQLVREEGRFWITADKGRVEVEIVPEPAFYQRTTSKGVPFWQIGQVLGGYIAIAPQPPRDLRPESWECQYCPFGLNFRIMDRPAWPVDEVLETIEAAFMDGAAEHVHLQAPYTAGEDAGMALIEPYLTAIKANFSTLVSLEGYPPHKDEWIEVAYAAGADAIAYNLGIFDRGRLAESCPEAAALLGPDRFWRALEHAVKIFPAGAVASSLIAGLEAPESTIRGIDALAAMGVIPTLTLFRPWQRTEFARFPLPETCALVPVFTHLHKTYARHRMYTSWISHFNVVTNAVDGRFFSDHKEASSGLLQTIFGPRLSGRFAVSISNLRRKLRVNRVSESYDSSSL